MIKQLITILTILVFNLSPLSLNLKLQNEANAVAPMVLAVEPIIIYGVPLVIISYSILTNLSTQHDINDDIYRQYIQYKLETSIMVTDFTNKVTTTIGKYMELIGAKTLLFLTGEKAPESSIVAFDIIGKTNKDLLLIPSLVPAILDLPRIINIIAEADPDLPHLRWKPLPPSFNNPDGASNEFDNGRASDTNTSGPIDSGSDTNPDSTESGGSRASSEP